jgi:proline-specific peptidase
VSATVETLVETPHGRVYVECEGDLARGAVVLAAGGPGAGHDHYHPWFSRLAALSAVVYFDYSGCGRSDRLSDGGEYSIELFADNLDAVRLHLGLDAIDLIALSFGGLPAVEYALRQPAAVRRLVLSNAQVSAAGWQRTNIDGVNAELRRLFPEAWRRICLLREQGVSSLDPAYQELVAQVLPDLEWVDPWDHPPLSREGGFEEAVYRSVVGPDPEWVVEGTLRGYDPLPRLRGIQAPTLVLTGRYDRLTPPAVADEIHEALDSGRRSMHVFERSAHRPWVEQPDEYVDVVGGFLAGR